MRLPNPNEPRVWKDGTTRRKSSFSGNNDNCVEGDLGDGVVYVRDTKEGPNGAALVVSDSAWTALLRRLGR